MATILRKQRAGSQDPWTLDELRAGLEQFNKAYGHYPTASEVDTYEYLPSARSIERSHGGMVALRKTLKLSTDKDLRSGAHSSARAKMINKRAYANEQSVYEYLCKRFGKELVHREYFFTDDHRTRADFFIYDAQEGFCVDVFYPNSVRNLTGCLNIKLKKYGAMNANLLPYPVIFLQMNKEITEEILKRVVANKVRQPKAKQYLMAWDAFVEFCNQREPKKIQPNSKGRKS